MSESTPLELLLSELDALPVSDGARAQFLTLLQRFSGERITLKRSVLTRPGKVHLADRLLGQNMPVAQCAAVLIERTGVSRPTAYRLLTLALAQRFARQHTQTQGGASQ